MPARAGWISPRRPGSCSLLRMMPGWLTTAWTWASWTEPIPMRSRPARPPTRPRICCGRRLPTKAAVLGRTSSGTVRLIDRMAEAGYVERGPGADGRSTSLSLTGAGRAAAERVGAARAAVLAGALDGLSAAERETFRQLMSKVLAGLVRGPGAVRWICRLCDTGMCRGTEGGCPVGNAVRARNGVHGG